MKFDNSLTLTIFYQNKIVVKVQIQMCSAVGDFVYEILS